jgi:hypothetical protein
VVAPPVDEEARRGDRDRAQTGRARPGIPSFDSIFEGPSALDDAIDDAPGLLSNCAERVMRMVMVDREI